VVAGSNPATPTNQNPVSDAYNATRRSSVRLQTSAPGWSTETYRFTPKTPRQCLWIISEWV
jgi:hypothetical protein